MPIKRYKPTTPGRRGASVQDFSDVTKKRPEKSLTTFLKEHAGRSKQTGKITVRHRGAGVKRLYRVVDFLQQKFDMPGSVQAIEYDPNRGPRIALIQFSDGKKQYVLAPASLKVGDVIVSSASALPIAAGNRMPLAFIPIGTMVHNVEFHPGLGGRLVRGAGDGAQVMSTEGAHVQLKLPSGERRLFPKECAASVGAVGNPDFRLVRLGKAGRKRHLGWRPVVTGKAMNPVDHPHGGGEGHQPIGLKRGPMTKWGKRARGVKTRKAHRASDKLILERRRK
ncbi:MAG: 50S ribosomal protein L2 [Candidatus Magasanikbacteria bacterium]|nr:50S ribosomal protein L2 [Candidatus Magasanikbacteria bacterium]